MEFQTDIFEGVQPPSSSKYNLLGVKLPTSQDVYFMSKWHEVFERYEIEELRKFDDEKLYPYVVGLLEKLKIAVNPSPMIM